MDTDGLKLTESYGAIDTDEIIQPRPPWPQLTTDN